MVGMSVLVMGLGGCIPVYLLSHLFEWALFKRVVDTPEFGKVLSVGFAVLVAIILYGFGTANGGPWRPGYGVFAYFLSGVIVLTLRLHFYHRREARRLEQGDPELMRTFE